MFKIRYLMIVIVTFTRSCWGSQRIYHDKLELPKDLSQNFRISNRSELLSELNPGCGGTCEEQQITTFHLRAQGPNDTLHYLWDFVQRPSILLAITSNTAQLNISWDDYLAHKPGSVKFTEEPFYTFGVVIEKIFEFNDVNNTGRIDTVNDENINVLRSELFKWTRKSQHIDEKFVELYMNGDKYTDSDNNSTRNGNIKIVLNGFCTLEHSDVMPHMLHSENSTQIDFRIENLETNGTFKNSRFGMELLIVSQESPNAPMSIDAKKTLDDEHTPGVFEVVEVRTPWKMMKDGMEEAEAYLQWRPVSYTSPERDVTSSTNVIHYQLKNCSIIEERSILYAYYGHKTSELLIEKINITIGDSDDGFYTKTNYATWTFIIGYGIPPDEQFSYLVIMIIAIGIGLPVIIMSVAAFYSCIRRLRRRGSDAFINS